MLGSRAPQQVGPYRVEGTLGQGGMGLVLRATDVRTGRPVAIKLLLAGRGAGATQRQRFAREARVLVRLRHPGIVEVLDAGEHEGSPYLVLALVDGRSLQDRLDREGPLDPTEAARLVRDVARAVDFVHRAQVLHRDLKPDNVLVGADGAPRLADFGIARDLAPEASRGLSASGVFLGSPGYWSPEQARGAMRELGPATDVHGLGALLYALLAGRPPFEGETLVEVLHQTLQVAPPSPARARPAGLAPVDAALDAIAVRCLAKDPAGRYPTADAVARALDAWLLGLPRRAGRGRRARRRVLVATAAAGVVLCAGAVALGLARARATPDGPAGPPSAPAATTPAAGQEPVAGAVPGQDRADPAPGRPPADAATNRAAALLRAGALDEAGAAIEALLVARPADARGLHLRGAWRFARGDAAGALEDVERSLATDAGDAEAWSLRGTLRYLGGDAAGAEADYQAALERAPARSEDWRNVALARRARGDLAGALDALDRAVACDPTGASRSERGQALLEVGRAAEALADFDAALALDPADHRTRARRGNARFLARDDAGAREDLDQAVAAAPDLAFARICRSLVRLAGGDVAGALEDAERAVALAPGDVQALRARGIARDRAGDPRGAVADLLPVAERLGTAAAWLELGPAHEGLADRRAAVEAYSRALAADPGSFRALHHRGGLHLQEGDLEAAAADLERALALAPNDVPCLVRAAMIDVHRGLGERAKARLARAVALEPTNANAWVWHGMARGPADAAGTVADCDRALALAPGDPFALASRANAKLVLGDADGARRDAEAALARARPGGSDEEVARRVLAACAARAPGR